MAPARCAFRPRQRQARGKPRQTTQVNPLRASQTCLLARLKIGGRGAGMLQDEPHRLAVDGGGHQTRPIRIAADVGAGDSHHLEQLVAREAYVLGADY